MLLRQERKMREFKNAVDELFEELERDNPNHFAVRQYKNTNWRQEKTAKRYFDRLWCQTCSI